MYSRQDEERAHSANDNRPPRHIPIPVVSDPNLYQQYSGAGYSQQGSYGNTQGAYDPYGTSGDVAFNPEEHSAYYQDTAYQSTPQDIPLLARTHTPIYDDPTPFLQHTTSRQSLQPGTPAPFLQHRESTQSFQSETSTAVPAAPPVQPGQEGDLFYGRFGNLVYDCPVPPKLLRTIPHTPPPGRDEFSHMRYSAATCDPKDFKDERFTLRQQLFGRPRHTELFIVVTMYNEDDVLFARTMAGVFQNIEYVCNGGGKYGGTWGKDGWKKIVVCVVSDGRAKIDKRTRAVLAALGVYQDGIAKEKVNDKDVTAHIYEYTTRVGIGLRNGVVETTPGSQCPVQMVFCLKEKNQKKINSHRWALQAFGAVLNPNIVVLLDAGTRPGPESIYQLWRAFDLNPMCGGACGEIKAMLGQQEGKFDLLWKNPLVACQNFEYKMSNILDKPMESAFGFISVLPGAFSAYKFLALQNDKNQNGPLEKYFYGEKAHANAGIFEKNMYLAEDRILCFELVAKRNSSWVLTYVCSATGATDVPEEMAELTKQRRRWLNGSFFAAVYALSHFYQIFRSGHSRVRKIMFLVEFFYQALNMLFSWFALGNFFLVFQILTTSLGSPELLGKAGTVIGVILEWIYLGSLTTCFVLSLGNRPDGSKKFWLAMVWVWGGIMAYLTFATLLIPIKSIQNELQTQKFSFTVLFSDSIFFTLIISLLSTYFLWIFMSICFLDPWHIITSSVQYFLLSPTYINVINVYAFCNTHDVSWGTRGDDKAEKLPTASVTKADGNLQADISSSDLDSIYDSELKEFSAPVVKEVKPQTAAEKQQEDEDYYKGFRSYVVLFWMGCNAALVAIILKSGGVERLSYGGSESGVSDPGVANSTVKTYLLVVLWSVAALSGFKFVGASWYLIHRIFVR